MYVAHSSIESQPVVSAPVKKIKPISAQERFNYEMALKGFRNACKKHAAAIAEIREVFPDYEPKFIYKQK